MRPADVVTRRAAAQLAVQDGRPFHDALLSARGWPEIGFDGRLLVTHQDALLMGGKVQAAPGFADHVHFRDLTLCAECDDKTCVAMCSGQAITLERAGPAGISSARSACTAAPAFGIAAIRRTASRATLSSARGSWGTAFGGELSSPGTHALYLSRYIGMKWTVETLNKTVDAEVAGPAR